MKLLAHNLREAIAREVLEGHVKIDDAYCGGHIRPHNETVKRVDRRIKNASDRQHVTMKHLPVPSVAANGAEYLYRDPTTVWHQLA